MSDKKKRKKKKKAKIVMWACVRPGGRASTIALPSEAVALSGEPDGTFAVKLTGRY